MRKRYNKILSYKFIRYIIGGGTAAVFDLSVLYVLTDIFDIYYLVSAIIAFMLSLSYGYMFHKYITFQSKSSKHVSHGLRFLWFQLFWLALYMFLLWLFVDIFGWWYMIVAVGAKGVVFLRNYVMNHHFNFKD